MPSGIGVRGFLPRSFTLKHRPNMHGNTALLLQGVAPAKATANDAAAAAKKKAADEEAAGEDDSKFDEFMVSRKRLSVGACGNLTRRELCLLTAFHVPAATSTPCCVT